MNSLTHYCRHVCSHALLLALLAGCTTVNTHPARDRVGPAAGPAPSPAPATTPATPAVTATGPLAVTITEAVLTGLENNHGFAVERLAPQVRRAGEELARSVFDPVLSGQVQRSRTRTEPFPVGSDPVTRSKTDSASVGLEQLLPFGTSISLAGSASRDHDGLDGDDLWGTGLDLDVTQPLLRGAGLGPNLASLRQARIDTQISEYELRGVAQTLVADIEKAYWDCSLAARRVAIFEQSLLVAERQSQETLERVRIGKLADSERAGADAEVALRRQELIDARAAQAQFKVRFLRLISPSGGGLWKREVELKTPAPEALPALTDPDVHVAAARRDRPDLNQARLEIRRGELELVKTRNGLLPKLDLFVSLGESGYARSFHAAVDANDGDSYAATAGLRVELPPLNRAARAQHTRALLNRRQAGEALSNLGLLAEEDVRRTCIEVARSRDQIAASAATRRLQEVKLDQEREKFRVGKSTSLLVAQAERDLLSSQVSEIGSRFSFLKAMVDLEAADGSLLRSRGLACPGAEPVAE